MIASNDKVEERDIIYDMEQYEKHVDYLRAVVETAQSETAE